MSNDWSYNIENILVGENPREEYLFFVMPLEAYLEYDDSDLYLDEYHERDTEY